MMRRELFIVILFFLPLLNLSGQGVTDRAKFFEADYAFMLSDYEKAFKIYESLIVTDPENANLNYLAGSCLMNIPGRKSESLPYFIKAIRDVTSNYKSGNYKGNTAPLETYFSLAKAYKYNDRFDKALETIKEYKTLINPKNKKEIDNIDEDILSIENAIKLKSRPVGFTTANIGKPVNSKNEEIYPVISYDETLLFFTVKSSINNKLYCSSRENGIWGKPQDISSILGSIGNCYPSSISHNKKRLYITVSIGGSTDIYYSEYNKNRWQKIQKTEGTINSKSWDSHACESSDGNTLYFSSDRKGTIGNMDIYKSIKKLNGTWAEPINLGSSINTSLNELMPVTTENNQYLYFKSEGHKSIGGYDIYYVAIPNDNEWTEPINLGYPINTPDDNIYFYPLQNGIYAYISNTSPENPELNDIYKMEIFSESNPRPVNIKGTISLFENDINFEKCSLKIIDKGTNGPYETIIPMQNTGEFSFILKKGNYQISIEKEGYLPFSQHLTIASNYPDPDINLNPALALDPDFIKYNSDTSFMKDLISENTDQSEPETGYEKSSQIHVNNEQTHLTFSQNILKSDIPLPDENHSSVSTNTSLTGLFTIQIMALKRQLDLDRFRNMPGIQVQESEDGYYRYIIGQYKDANLANKERKKIAQSGYKTAFVRYYDITRYLSQNKSIPVSLIVESDYVFTIQIIALNKPAGENFLKKFTVINSSRGDDGIYRYTTDYYPNIYEAKNELKRIRDELGFKNAFIKKVTAKNK